MTRKNTTIRQGVVTEMMAAFANLPKREKLAGDLLPLPEIFRSKEYLAEIKGALKRGYSFDDLAEIFSEQCRIGISARQIRYHFTHSQNLGMKYQRKGSGTVIVVGDVTVKASDVSRNLTLGKLEKQLEKYREMSNLAQLIYNDQPKIHKPQPLDNANRNKAQAKTAKEVFLAKTLKELRYISKYRAAEQRAGENAYRAIVTGNIEAARHYKSIEMINHAMYEEGNRVRERVENDTRWTGRFRPDKLSPVFIRPCQCFLRYNYLSAV